MEQVKIIDGKYQYYAFISYKREDEEWAKWLQHKLEHYKLPSNLNGRTDFPKEIRPVFKDTSELLPGNLPKQIQEALELSKYLIVICSPRSAQSRWVNKEVEAFIEINHGKPDKIIPFIIDGIAFSKDPQCECFPQAIKDLPEEQEILGANIDEMGREAAVVKTVARMFDLKFDVLWQRHEREKEEERQKLIETNNRICRNQARFISEKAKTLVDEGDSYTACLLALEVLPTPEHPDFPYTPEAEYVLRKSLECCQSKFISDEIMFSAKFSSDGEHIVTSVMDNAYRIWDTRTGACIAINKKRESTTYAAYNADGTRIVTATRVDNIIQIWDVYTEELLQTFEGHEGNIVYLAFIRNGNVISASEDQTIKLWDTETGKLVRDVGYYSVFRGKTTISSQAETFAHQTRDLSIGVFDLFTGNILHELKGGTKSVIGYIVFSPDGKWLAGTSNDTVYIWSVCNELLVCELSEIAGPMINMAFCPNNNLIAIASYQNPIEVREVQTGNLVATFAIDVEKDITMEFSPDGESILCFSSSWFTFKVLNLRKNDTQRNLRGHEENIISFAFNSDEKKAISLDSAGFIKVWNVDSGAQIGAIDTSLESPYCAVLTRDEQHLLVVSTTTVGYNGKYLLQMADSNECLEWIVSIWDLEGHICSILEGTDEIPDYVTFSSDNRRLVANTCDGIQMWENRNNKLVILWEKYDTNIKSIAFDAKGLKIVSTSYDDNWIRVWDSNTGDLLYELEGDDELTCICISYNGDCVACGSEKGIIRVWNLQTRRVVASWSAFEFQIASIAYSPDGSKILTTTFGAVKIWDAFTGALIYTIEKEETMLNYESAIFSHDGRKVIAICDKNICIWDFPPLKQLIGEAQDRLKNRKLTHEQRRKYYLE